jgi:hypothetical protein
MHVIAALACAAGAGAQEAGRITVTVVDAATQRSLNGARVSIEGDTTSDLTDSLGFARLRGVPEGLSSILVRRIGYHPAREVNVRVTRGKATLVTVRLSRAPVQLETTAVVADALPHDGEQTVSGFVYSDLEIRRTPGAAGDLFRAIETLPGVSSSGGEFSAFSVRGGGPRDNLILIDEIPFDKVTHLEGGNAGDEAQGGRFSIFAPDIVQSAYFRAGGFPAQYGGKNASVLSLKLREGNTETATVGGRYDLLGWEADYDGPARFAHTGLLVSARHENLRRALKLIGRQDAGAPSFTDLILKSTTPLGARNKLTVLGIYAPEEVRRTVADILTESDTNDAALYHWKETKGVFGATLRTLAGSASVIQTSVYLQRYTRATGTGEAYPDAPVDNGASIASRADVLQTNESETGAGFRSVARLVHGANALTTTAELTARSLSGGRSVAGLDTLYTFDRNDPRPTASQDYLVIGPGTYNAAVDRRVTDLAFSSSYSRSFLVDGDMTLGIRVERDGVSGRTSVLPRASAATPRIDGFVFSAAGGVYVQPLLLRDLIGSAANSVLPPERSAHLIAGVSRVLAPDLQLTVEGYYRTLSDVAVLRDRTTGFETAAGTGYATGVDITLVKQLIDRFFGQVSYSYSKSRRNDHRGDPWYDGDGNQPQSFNILAGYTLNSRWSFSGKFKFADGKPTDSFVVHENIFGAGGPARFSQEIVRHNGARQSSVQTLNLRLDYQRQARSIGIDAFLDVLNAFDRLNVNNARFVERTGRIHYDGVPIVPTFGLKLLY